MKIIKKSQRQEFKHEQNCIIYEYNMGDKDMDGCIVELNGRYPKTGWAINNISKEMAYVIGGKGTIAFGNKKYPINSGDALLINPGEKFYWEGNMELFIPCTPAWSPEQYKTIK